MKYNRNLSVIAIGLLMTVGSNMNANAGNYLTDYAVDTIAGGNTLNYHVMAIYSDGTSADITDHATVEYSTAGCCEADKGVIIGKNYGDVTLTFGYQGATDNLPLIIQNVKAARTVASIAFTPETISLPLSGKTTFATSAVYQDGHQEDITHTATFYSTNPAVARVNADSVIAVAYGTAAVKTSYKVLVGEAVEGLLPITINYNDPYSKNEAESFTSQSGVICETLNDSDKNVAFIENGDWVQYEGMDFGANGPTSFSVVGAVPGAGGSVNIYADDTLIGTCNITNTTSWTSWKTFSCNVSKVTGVKKVRLVFTGGSGYLFNINSWCFAETPTGINAANVVNGQVNAQVDVYDTNGIMIRKHVNRTEWKKGLDKGFYIVDNKIVKVQ